MKDDSKRISVAVTDTYAIMSYHMENGTINISSLVLLLGLSVGLLLVKKKRDE